MLLASSVAVLGSIRQEHVGQILVGLFRGGGLRAVIIYPSWIA